MNDQKKDNIYNIIESKQPLLISGFNIKTINNKSILGPGDMELGSGSVNTDKKSLGLENVDNTSDLNKPVSTYTQNALNNKQDVLVSSINIKTLNNSTLLGSGNIEINKVGLGLSNVDNTSDLNKPVSVPVQNALDSKQDVLVSSINIKTLNNSTLLGNGNIEINKVGLGLSNIDNTSDLNKPVSIPVQNELNHKQDILVSSINIKTLNNSTLLGSGNIEINKVGLGLSNVDNTSDLNKPVSNSVQNALNLKENVANKNVAFGYAGLNGSGKLNINQLPVSGLNYIGIWNANLNLPTISPSVGNAGDFYKVNVSGNSLIDGYGDWNIGDWIIFNGYTWDKIDNSESVNSVSGKIGSVILNKNDVGLDKVDNTSDLNKPISTYVQNALNNKQDTLISQTSIKSLNSNSLLGAGNLIIDKNSLGLDKVDNTSDLNKPISTYVQNALNLKENISNKNIPNGYVGLDSSGKINKNLIPFNGLNYLGVWNANSNTPQILSSSGNIGDYYKVSIAGNSNIDGIMTWDIGDWIIFNGSTWDKIDNSETVLSVAGKIGNVVLVKNDVGLSNVDNTSDLSKPISIYTQNELNKKQDKLISGVNIQSINNNSLLGNGNINIVDSVALLKFNGVTFGVGNYLPTLTKVAGNLNISSYNSTEFLLERSSTYEISFSASLYFSGTDMKITLEAYENNNWVDVSFGGATWMNARQCSFITLYTTNIDTRMRLVRSMIDSELFVDSCRLFIKKLIM